MSSAPGGECFRVLRDAGDGWSVIEYLHNGATRLHAGCKDRSEAEALAERERPLHDTVFHADDFDLAEGPDR